MDKPTLNQQEQAQQQELVRIKQQAKQQEQVTPTAMPRPPTRIPNIDTAGGYGLAGVDDQSIDV
jgi:hypothetical protein